MPTDDLKARARDLRAAGKTPQQIARTLGVTRAKANDLVRGTAVRRPVQTEPPLVGCWISRQWSSGLRIDDRPADWLDDEDQPPFAVGAGLAQVLVARESSSSEVSVCGYLIDTYCLGVKNAVEPRTVAWRHLDTYVEDYFAAYPDPALPAPIELVRDLVLGAVEYARTLGFDPHQDFYLAAPHLGGWEPPGRITFGLDGTPFFQHGPYDDPTRVIRTLDRTVGQGNYQILVVHGMG